MFDVLEAKTMKTLKQYCIFNHPHEQPCQVDINDVREWLTQKRQQPRGWSVEQHQITGANALLDELLEELNQ